MKILSFFLIFLLIAPSVFAIQEITVREGDFVKLRTSATDPDEDQITYKYSKPLSSKGEWQTTFDDAGIYVIKVIASDGKDEVTEELRLVVLDINRKPDFTIEELIELNEGDEVQLNFPRRDADGDEILYKISEPLNDLGFWQTTFEDAGEYEILVSATDRKSTVEKEFKIIVHNVDRIPEFNKIKKVIGEGNTVKIELNKDDPDGDDIIYEAPELIPGMSFDGEVLIWKIPFDFVTKGDSRTIDLSIPVKNNGMNFTQEVEIIAINNNRAPVIEVQDEFTINEGEDLHIKPNIFDPDGEPVDVQLTGDFTSFNIKTDFNSAGTYKVKISATDRDLTTEKEITLDVLNVNRAPEILSKFFVIPEAKTSEIDLPIVDRDGDTVKIKQIELPEGAEFEEGKIIWTPGYDFVEHKFQFAPTFLHGILNKIFKTKFYERSVEATLFLDDGQDLVEEKIKIIVQDINRKPIVADIDKTLTLKQGETALPPVLGKDEDGDQNFIGYKNHFGPVRFDEPGTHEVEIVVSDGTSREIRKATIEVEEVPKPPVLIIGKHFSVKENQTIKIPITVIDDEETNVFVKDLLPGHSIINNTLIYTPDFNEVQHTVLDENGTIIKNPDNFIVKNVTIVAENSAFFVEQDITIKIKDVNRVPKLVTFSPTNKFKVSKGHVMEFFVDVEDPDGDKLEYIWSGEAFKRYRDDNRHVRKLNAPGLREMKVTISDGMDSIEHEWQFIVKS